MDSNPINTGEARKILRYSLIGVLIITFLPLLFDTRFRKLVAVALLGIFYSCFLVNVWDRWTRTINQHTNSTVLNISQTTLRFFHTLLPFRSWGVVPFIVQVFILVAVFGFGWFLAPLFYEIVHNPSTLGWIRRAIQQSAPELYKFLNELTYSVDPWTVVRQNAQQIITSFNRFYSAFVVPVTFIIFTGIGAALYDSLEFLLLKAEESDHGHSEIMDTYGSLFGEYLKFNAIYYILLGSVISSALAVMDFYEISQFGWKIIIGLFISFFLGNLFVPGLGTLIMTALTVGMLYLWQGIVGAGVSLLCFTVYFLFDDYLVKPSFLLWLGRKPGREWEFGIEVIATGLILLYASFGLLGTLLLFPSLCFLDAYLRQRNPQLRRFVLSPLRMLNQ
ncbi:MAG: hypothetical protein ABEJ65_07045 [bacterium]